MSRDLEKRLAALESELRVTKRSSAERGHKIAKWLHIPYVHGRKQALVFTSILLLVTSISMGTHFYLSNEPSSSTSSRVDLKQVQENAGFETYFPTTLPDGFKFSTESVTLSEGVIIYTVTIPNGAKVVVTQQARTDTFDYKSINTPSSFTTLYGTANVYEQGDKTMASMVTETTWLLCNSTKAIGTKAMEDILQGMRTP